MTLIFSIRKACGLDLLLKRQGNHALKTPSALGFNSGHTQMLNLELFCNSSNRTSLDSKLFRALEDNLPSSIGAAPLSSESFSNGERHFFVFHWGIITKPAACIRLLFHPQEMFLWLGLIELAPEYQGAGIGKQLVRKVEETAREQDVLEIRLFPRFHSRSFWRHLRYASRNGAFTFHKHINKSTCEPANVISALHADINFTVLPRSST